MARIEARLQALGLVLPPPMQPPPGMVLPFRFVRVVGRRALISGHGPQNADGSFAAPLGKLGRELTVEQGYVAARLTALSMLGSLQRELGDLDRIARLGAGLRHGQLGAGFNRQPSVINGFSDLILELFGPEVGAHSRSAVGMAELPFDIPVEIEGEVELVGLRRLIARRALADLHRLRRLMACSRSSCTPPASSGSAASARRSTTRRAPRCEDGVALSRDTEQRQHAAKREHRCASPSSPTSTATWPHCRRWCRTCSAAAWTTSSTSATACPGRCCRGRPRST